MWTENDVNSTEIMRLRRSTMMAEHFTRGGNSRTTALKQSENRKNATPIDERHSAIQIVSAEQNIRLSPKLAARNRQMKTGLSKQ